MKKGWFKVDGVQDGERSLSEQLKGVQPALDSCAGKTVLDLGCAEGLIALEFARAGAKSVWACDCNAEAIASASALREQVEAATRAAVSFHLENVNELAKQELASGDVWRYDIVLALAILHKMHDPAQATRYAARATGERLVLRLPVGSDGVITSKWGDHPQCDTGDLLASEGLRLEANLKGPRGELVQHWVR